MAFLIRGFIDADLLHHSLLPPLQTPLHRPFLNARDFIPAEVHQVGYRGHRGFLEPVDHQGFKEGGETRIGFRPCDGELSYTMLPAVGARHAAFDHRLQLAGIEVPPPPYLMVVDRRGSRANRTGNRDCLVVADFDDHRPFLQLQLHVGDLPRFLDTQDLIVELDILHDVTLPSRRGDSKSKCREWVAHRLSRPRILGDALLTEHVDNSLPAVYGLEITHFLPTRKPEAPEFPSIINGGGFDCIIGNPPYVRIQTMKEWAPFEVEEYKSHYRSARSGNYDIYVVFVEKGLSLLNQTGLLGYILPHKFFNAQYGEQLREIISTGKYLRHVVHFTDQQIFADATTYTCLLFLDKAGTENCHFSKVESLAAWIRNGTSVIGDIPLKALSSSKWTFSIGKGGKLVDKLSRMPSKLVDVAERMAQGIRTSANEVYVLDVVSTSGNYVRAHSKILDKEVKLEKASICNFLQGREIRPFHVEPSGKVVIIPYSINEHRATLIEENELEGKYPRTYEYLKQNKEYLCAREHGRMHGGNWYGYVYPKNIEIMHVPKILVPDIANQASFAFDRNGEYAFTSGYGVTLKTAIGISPLYLMGLLNSPVLDYFLKQVSTTMRGGYFRYFTQYIEQIPIILIDLENAAKMKIHNEIVQLIENIVKNHAILIGSAKTQHDKKLIEDRIMVYHTNVNQIIFELYDLTPEEIKIVEGQA